MPKPIIAYLLLLASILSFNGCKNTPLPPLEPVKIAIINPGQRFSPFVKGFKQRMRDLDYLEGENTIYLYDGPTPADQLTQRLLDLKTQDIDLLYTFTTPVTQKAHEIFKDSGIPIVFGPVYSPQHDGLTSSLSKPDKNMTGVMIRGNTAKAFGFLKEAMPSLKSISVPFPYRESTSRHSVHDLRKAAEKLGVTVIAAKIQTRSDLTDYLRQIPAETEAIWLPHSPFIMRHFGEIMATANAKKIPVASATSQFNYRTLLSYGPDLEKIGKQAARLADELLHGVPASELPIEQCEYYLAVNLEVAFQTGVTIPDTIVRQARLINSVKTPSPPPSHPNDDITPNHRPVTTKTSASES